MSELTNGDSAPWYSKRSLVIIAIFFIVISMAIIGITTAAHLAWQSSPEKALLDALDYSSKTPATYKVATKDANVVINYDGTRQAVSGTYKTIAFNAIVSGNMLYVKSDTPAELVKLFTPADLPENFKPATDAITQRINGKWVSVSLERLPLADAAESKNVTCALNANSQLITNKDAKKELAKLYDSNGFIMANKTATTDKSNAYSLSVDSKKFDGFANEFIKSTFYTSLKSDCDNLVKSTIAMKNLNADMAVDVLLSKSKNALQKATIRNTGGETTVVDVRYGSVGTVTVPTDSITYDSISSSVVQTMIQSYLNGTR